MRIRISALRVLVGLSLVAGIGACTEPNAAYLANTGGGAQTVAVGAQAPLPLSVTVKDYNGDSAEGVEVVWTIRSGGGSLSASTTSTDGDGKTSVTYTAGSTAGQTIISASVPALGASVGFTMTVQ